MKKNTFIKIVFGILSLLSLITCSSLQAYAGWPFNKTPAIEGVIRDATMGEPIENVHVNFWWTKKFVIGVPPDGVISKAFASKNVLTDKEGRYRIPSKISFHLLTYFSSGSIAVRHPLYENKVIWSFYKKDYETKKWITVGKMRDNVINYDVDFLSMEDKYVKVANSLRQDKALSNEERKKSIYTLDSRFYSFIDTYSSGVYFLFRRSKSKLFDLDKIINSWKHVAEKIAYDEGRYYKRIKDINSIERKIRKRLTSEIDK